MATRSIIGKCESNGSIVAIYCHWNGYPDNNGNLLLNYWTNELKINALMKLGNLSSLGKEIGSKQDFNRPTDTDWCLAYGRDRRQTKQNAVKLDSLDDFVEYTKSCGADYAYLWEEGNWLCWNYDGDVIDLYATCKEVA